MKMYIIRMDPSRIYGMERGERHGYIHGQRCKSRTEAKSRFAAYESVFIESKRELNNRLMELPGGNLEKIGELNKKFDEIIEDELSRLESGRPLRQLARKKKRGRDGAGAACKETKMG